LCLRRWELLCVLPRVGYLILPLYSGSLSCVESSLADDLRLDELLEGVLSNERP